MKPILTLTRQFVRTSLDVLFVPGTAIGAELIFLYWADARLRVKTRRQRKSQQRVARQLLTTPREKHRAIGQNGTI